MPASFLGGLYNDPARNMRNPFDGGDYLDLPNCQVARPGGVFCGTPARARMAVLTGPLGPVFSISPQTFIPQGDADPTTNFMQVGGGGGITNLACPAPSQAQAKPTAPFNSARITPLGLVGGIYSARILLTANMNQGVQIGLLGEDGTFINLANSIGVSQFDGITEVNYHKAVFSIMTSFVPDHARPSLTTGPVAAPLFGHRIIFDTRIVFGDNRAWAPVVWFKSALANVANADFIFETPSLDEEPPVLAIQGSSLVWTYGPTTIIGGAGGGFRNKFNDELESGWQGLALDNDGGWLVYAQSAYSPITGNLQTNLNGFSVIARVDGQNNRSFNPPTFGLFGGQSFYVVGISATGMPVTPPSNVVQAPDLGLSPTAIPALTVNGTRLMTWTNPLPYNPAMWLIWNTNNIFLQPDGGLTENPTQANGMISGKLRTFQLPALLPVTPGFTNPTPTTGQSFLVIGIDAQGNVMTTPSNAIVGP